MVRGVPGPRWVLLFLVSILSVSQVGGWYVGAYTFNKFPLTTTSHCHTYPGDDKLSTKVLYFSLDLATDVELVAVESDALEVGQQVLLAGGVWALMGQEVQHCMFPAPLR